MKKVICVLLVAIMVIAFCTGIVSANTVAHSLDWNFGTMYDRYFDGNVNRIFYDYGNHWALHPDARASAGIEIAGGMSASSEMTIYSPIGISTRMLKVRSTSGWCTTDDAYVQGQTKAERLYGETYRSVYSTGTSTTYTFNIY